MQYRLHQKNKIQCHFTSSIAYICCRNFPFRRAPNCWSSSDFQRTLRDATVLCNKAKTWTTQMDRHPGSFSILKLERKWTRLQECLRRVFFYYLLFHPSCHELKRLYLQGVETTQDLPRNLGYALLLHLQSTAAKTLQAQLLYKPCCLSASLLCREEKKITNHQQPI